MRGEEKGDPELESKKQKTLITLEDENGAEKVLKGDGGAKNVTLSLGLSKI